MIVPVRLAGPLAGLLALAGCAAAVGPPAGPPEAEPGFAAVLGPGPVPQSNRDIARDFADLTFELETGAALDGLLRFERPVRVELAGGGLDAFAGALEALLGRLRAEAGIDIAMAGGEGNLRIVVAPAGEMRALAPGVQCFVVPALIDWARYRRGWLGPERLDWTTVGALEAATVFIPEGATPIEVQECLEEEIAQALGALNDLFHLADSVFNDDNVHSRLSRFDLLILRVLYDRRLSAGMPRREAQAMALTVLDEINPDGRALARRSGPERDRDWDGIMARVYSGDRSLADRRVALRRALAVAQRFPTADHRLSHTLYLLAYTEFEERPELAEGLLRRAIAALPQGARYELRLATLRFHLALATLRLRKDDEALTLAGTALPVLLAYGETERLAIAHRLRATALDRLGRADEAAEAAAEARDWGRLAWGVTGSDRRFGTTPAEAPGG